MRHSLKTPVALLLVLAVAGCAKCGKPKQAVPVDRFVASNAAAVLVVPRLATLAQQSADVLTTAATFPGGKDLLDARAVIGNRLTFDPFDAVSIAATGLDPERGLALSAVVGKAGEQSPDVVLAVPVADAQKFEAAVTKIAKEKLDATDRKAEPGAPEVVTWRMGGAEGPILFGYAVVEGTALLSFGPAAVDAVRAAAAVPATATIATAAGYQKSMKALGDGMAFEFFVPANSPALKDVPQLKEGFAVGVRAGRDRIGVAAAMLLGDRAAAIKAAVAKGESAALLAKLDPGAVWVARGDSDPAQSTDVQTVLDTLAKQGIPEPAIALLKDVIESLGTGSALGVGVIAPAADSTVKLSEAPLAAVRAEVLATLKDPEKMTATIQRAIDMVAEQAGPPPAPAPAKGKKAKKVAAPAKPDFGKNPWRFPLPGGEIAAAVADGRLALAVGPAGALEALLARTGTTFKAPTPAAEKALKSGTGGMYLDVPKLAAAAKAFPEAAFGEGSEGAMAKSMIDTWSASAARITAISVSGDLLDGAARGELLVEVTPTAAPAAPAAK